RSARSHSACLANAGSDTGLGKERPVTLADQAAVDSEVQQAQLHGHRWLWPVGWLAAMVCMGGLGAYHLIVYAPHLDPPHHLAVLDRLFDMGVVAPVLFCGLLIGLRCLGWLRLGDAFEPLETLALATGVGLGALSLGTLVLGFLHLYYG